MKPTFSPTVSESNSAAFWKTMPSRRLSPESPWSESRPTRGTPLMRISPLSGASRPAVSRRVVLLPVPDAPMIPTASPRRILKLAPFKMRLSPKDLWTSLNSTSTSASMPVPLLLLVLGAESSRDATAVSF